MRPTSTCGRSSCNAGTSCCPTSPCTPTSTTPSSRIGCRATTRAATGTSRRRCCTPPSRTRNKPYAKRTQTGYNGRADDPPRRFSLCWGKRYFNNEKDFSPLCGDDPPMHTNLNVRREIRCDEEVHPEAHRLYGRCVLPRLHPHVFSLQSDPERPGSQSAGVGKEHAAARGVRAAL